MNNKEDKHKKIIATAEKLFFENNYEEVSMSKIAKEAGIAKGTLYLYFSSKKDLYFSVVVKALDIIEDVIRKNVSKAKNGLEKVVSMGRSYIEFYNDYLTEIDFISDTKYSITLNPTNYVSFVYRSYLKEFKKALKI